MELAQLDLIINAAPAKAGRAEFEREVAQLESKATASAGRITKGHETAGASIRGMGREVAAAGAVFGSAGGPVTAFAGRLSTVGTAVDEMTRSLGAARVGKQALEAAFTSGLTAAPTIGAALAAQAAGYEKLKAAQTEVGKTTQWLTDLQTRASTAKLDLSTAKANVGDAKADLATQVKGTREYEAAQQRVTRASTELRAETKRESDARTALAAVTVKDKAAHDALNAAMRDQKAITETVAVASNSYGAALAGVAVKATAVVGVIAAVGAGVAAYEVLKKSLNEGGELEALETRFATMIGNSQAARAEMEKLENIHLRSPFDLADLERAAQRLYSVGEGTNDLSEDVRRLAEVAAGTGQKSVGSLAEGSVAAVGLPWSPGSR